MADIHAPPVDHETGVEVWRSIRDLPANAPAGLFFVSSAGRVWKIGLGIVPAYLNSGGYYHVHINGAHFSWQPPVHQLVAKAFIPKPPGEGLHICHLDGNKLNCCLTNLAWASASENRNHTELHRADKPVTPDTKFVPTFIALANYVVRKGWMTLPEIAAVADVNTSRLRVAVSGKKARVRDGRLKMIAKNIEDLRQQSVQASKLG